MDKKLVNKIFNIFYKKNKMLWTTNHIPIEYLVFMVYYIINSIYKEYIIVNIHNLNKAL